MPIPPLVECKRMVSYVYRDVLTGLVLVFPFSPLVHPPNLKERVCAGRRTGQVGMPAPETGHKTKKIMEHVACSILVDNLFK